MIPKKADMNLLAMNEKAWIWLAMDGSDETRDGTPVMEKFAVKFKEPETAKLFESVFNSAKPKATERKTEEKKSLPVPVVEKKKESPKERLTFCNLEVLNDVI